MGSVSRQGVSFRQQTCRRFFCDGRLPLVRGIALLWLSLCGQACGLSSRLQDPIPIATKVVGHDIQALLAEALAKRQQSPDSGDDRYEEDSEEMEKLREQLEGQYDQWLEDAALKAFKVSLAHPAGKRATD